LIAEARARSAPSGAIIDDPADADAGRGGGAGGGGSGRGGDDNVDKPLARDGSAAGCRSSEPPDVVVGEHHLASPADHLGEGE